MSNPEPLLSPSEMVTEMVRALGVMADITAPIIEAVEGYRAQLERDGYGDALARYMAADYHAGIMRMVLK